MCVSLDFINVVGVSCTAFSVTVEDVTDINF